MVKIEVIIKKSFTLELVLETLGGIVTDPKQYSLTSVEVKENGYIIMEFMKTVG